MAVVALFAFFIMIIAYVIDDDTVAFIAFISGLVCLFALGLSLVSDEVNCSITAQEIEYVVNKCSSFGGLKEFTRDDIICMDGTAIKMNFIKEKVEIE